MPTFIPTHEITYRGQVIPVRLNGGNAYTEAEWHGQGNSQWEYEDRDIRPLLILNGRLLPPSEYVLRALEPS